MNRTAWFFGVICMSAVLSAHTAMAQQAPASNNVLTAEQLQQFGDYTVEEALMRLPGVQVNRDGTINLRGAGTGAFYVTVNGQRMGTTGLGNRSADLSAIPVDLITEIEIIKVLTPDMAADGLAGAINLKTHQPNSEEIQFEGGLGAGVNTEYSNRTGATGRSWLQVDGPVSDKLNLSIALNYQRQQQAWESLEMGYGVQDFGNGNVNVLDRFGPGLQIDGSNRFGSTFQLDYNHSENSSFFARGMINIDNREVARHQNLWLAEGNWDDANTTAGFATFNYHMNIEHRDITQYTFQAGGEHSFSSINLNYTAGWARSSISREENLFPFRATGVQYQTNTSNPGRPAIELVEGEEMPVPEDMNLQEMTYIVDNHIDEKITGQVNVEIPFTTGMLTFGSSAMLTNKDANESGAYSEYHYTYQGFLNLAGFEQTDAGAESVFGNQYRLGRVIDTEEALDFFESSIPNMRLDAPAYYRDSEIYNYYADENIFAGYGMGVIKLGPATITAGVRAEHTMADYESRNVAYNRFEQFEEASDTAASTSYTTLIPHASVDVAVSDQSNLRVSYSRSLLRPDFNMAAPFELTTPGDTTIFQGNPGLDPLISDNIELYVDFAPNESGLISIGGFYKSMSNFVMMQTGTRAITEANYPNFSDYFEEGVTEVQANYRTYENSDQTVVLYGAEVALQQQLSFLPGVLNHFGLYANYTWTDSEFETGRGDETALIGQSPHVVNAALNYNDSKFKAQLAYHWSDELLSARSPEQEPAPAASNNPVYLHRYQDGYQRVTATVRYKFSEQFQVWANLYQLLATELDEYEYSREHYPTSIYNREGITFNAGIQVNL